MEKRIARASGIFLAITGILALVFVSLPRALAKTARRRGKKQGYDMKQFKLDTRDGTRLSAVLYRPLDPPEKPEGYPAIIMVHSWAMSRWQSHLYAPLFASDGYVVLSYDCRGWGSSGGKVQCAGPEDEVHDLSDTLDWLLGQEEAPVNPERIGLTGISYGGGHSFLFAARDKRIRTIVPMHGWTDLRYSLVPNGSLKYPWGLALLLTGSWATKLDPRNRLYSWTSRLLFDMKGKEEVLGDLDQRSAIHDVGEVECPVFMVGSWHDDLFDPNQMLKYYEKLDVPKKLYVGFRPHGMDSIAGPRLWSREIWDKAKDWFDYWLKDRTDLPILEEPSFHSRQAWKSVAVSFEDWPPPEVEVETLYLHNATNGERGSLKDTRPLEPGDSKPLTNNFISRATSGPSFLRPQSLGLPVPGPRKDVEGSFISYVAPPARDDSEIIGAPQVTLNIRPDRETCQVNALLYDAWERGLPRLITHGTCTATGLKPGETNQVYFDLTACDWKLKHGHRVRLTLSASNTLFVRPLYERFRFEVVDDPGSPSMLELPCIRQGT